MRSGEQDHPGQHGEIPSLLNIQKLVGHNGMCLQSQILGRLRQENCLNLGDGVFSELRLCHSLPTEGDSVSKRKNQKQTKNKGDSP